MKFIKNIFKILISIFSIIGLITTVFFIKEVVDEIKEEANKEESDLFEDDEYEEENNCTILLNSGEEHSID